MPSDRPTTRVRLIFADRGDFHAETVDLPLDALDQYDRLLDLLREDPTVTRRLHLDPKRLVAAYVVED